ncbi:unnamed protein product, partial [Cuscuta epithymum]
MVSAKGKEKVSAGDKGSAGKRKADPGRGKDDDKTGKRHKRDVLQFFEDSAHEVGDDDDDFSDDSDFNVDDFIQEDLGVDEGVQNEHVKRPVFPLVPKEEEMDEEELEKMLRERYKPSSSFVRYAEDGYERKGFIDEDISVPSSTDPTIWKVKCTVGRERHSAFCLMQKYVDLHALGTKIQTISVYAPDHVKGFVYIEAEKQRDVIEACKGLASIYCSRMAQVPRNEISQLFSVRSKCHGISKGMWARVKSGRYKGDLAQVVAVSDRQAKVTVTVKLIPRIDLQALADKFGGGVAAKKASIPTARFISSTELEDFRPLITYRKDRDTNEMYEVLDGKMLKEGYLYKKMSVDSLCLWGVMPSEAELLKFEPPKKNVPQDTEWLSQLYGESTRKQKIKNDKGSGKGGEKGECSSSSGNLNSFEVDDLVFFGRKDFGIIVGTEKENVYKIIKEGSEGPALVTLQLRELRAACFDRKLFTVKDRNQNTISINNVVRVLDGPSKDRQGTVKQIYKGVIFLYDELGEEHNRYVCVKAQMCEKISCNDVLLSGKENEAGPSSAFDDSPSSPNTPLSPKKPCRGRDVNSNFHREDKDGLFSVGQSVRIRVGPLKGYICRVLAVRQTDVTVKLDSRQQILTVKSEHLSEVHGKSSNISLSSTDPEGSRPFDLFGAQDGSRDWADGGIQAAQDDSWNAGLSSNGRNSWPSFPSSSLPTVQDPNTSSLTAVDVNKEDTGSSAWEIGTSQSKDAGQGSGWGGSDSWKKVASTSVAGTSGSDSWGKTSEACEGSIVKNDGSSWGAAAKNEGPSEGWGNKVQSERNDGPSWGNSASSQGKGTTVANNDAWVSKGAASSSLPGPVSESGGWGSAGISQDGGSQWGKQDNKVQQDVGSSWGNKKEDESSWAAQGGGSSLGQHDGKGQDVGSAWSSKEEKSSWGKQGGSSWGQQESKVPNISGGGEDGGSSWGKKNGGGSVGKQDVGSSWNNKEDKSSWGKQGGGSSWGQQDSKEAHNSSSVGGGSSWGKQDGGGSWNKQDGGGSSFGKQDGGGSWSKQDSGGSSWGKQDGGSSWSKQDGGGSSFGKQDGGGSWSKQDGGGSTWGKQDGGGSWSKQDGGGSSFGKQDGGGSWSKQDGGGYSWGKQDGGGSWSKQEGQSSGDGPHQQGSWGSGGGASDGGRGGGRRGRGRGRDSFGRGGGRGRSFDHGGESNSWGKDTEGNFGSGFAAAGGLPSNSWKSESSWGRTSDGSKKDDWGNLNASSRDDNSSGKNPQGWGVVKDAECGGSSWKSQSEKQEGWGSAAAGECSWKSSQESSWGKVKSTDENKTDDWGSKQDVAGEKWNSKAGSSLGWKSDQSEKPDDNKDGAACNNKQADWQSGGGWNAAKPSAGESQPSSWTKKPIVDKGTDDTNEVGGGWNATGKGSGSETKQSSGWNNKSSNESSAVGWGSSGNQSSGWKSESNWNSGGSGFGGGNEHQDD